MSPRGAKRPFRPRIKRHRSQSQRKLNVSVDSCSPFATLMPVLNLLHARTVSRSVLCPARSMFSLSGLTSVRKFALLGLVKSPLRLLKHVTLGSEAKTPHPLRAGIEFLSEQCELRNSGAGLNKILTFNKILQIQD